MDGPKQWGGRRMGDGWTEGESSTPDCSKWTATSEKAGGVVESWVEEGE